MENQRLINIINSRIREINDRIEAFDREGRNVKTLLSKIEAYEDVLMLLSE